MTFATLMAEQDYEALARERDYFGNFDPFGDFDRIFGAAKQNPKIIETPIHYKARTFGETQDLALPRRLAAVEDGLVRLSQAEGDLIHHGVVIAALWFLAMAKRVVLLSWIRRKLPEV